MSLARLQRDFRDYLRTGGAALEPAVPEGARRGLNVYHHAFRANLVACLRDTFEKTAAWLGDDAFETAALEHIADHPPSSWTLNDYGEGFDATLGALYPADPEVAELAWLDWTLRRAFDGPDSPEPDPAAWGEVDWDAAVLRLAPTFTLRPVRTNCAALWRAMADQDPRVPVNLLEGFAGVAVWRADYTPCFRSLDGTEYRALEAALSGATFGAICEMAEAGLPDGEDAVAVIGGMLARWIGEKSLVGAGEGDS